MANPMPGKSQRNDFIVRLDGLPLDPVSKRQIAAAIQSAVLAELGKIDLTGNQPENRLAHIPIQWLGIWLRDLTKLPEDLGELGKTLGVRELGSE
jgi:hypothetical protein